MSESKPENARDPEQLQRMIDLRSKGLCFFCDKNYEAVGASPAIQENQWWYAKKNDYPYKGAHHHFVIVSKTHLKKMSEISHESFFELQKLIEWIERENNLKGYSLLVRQGDALYTGATFDHLHIHLIAGGPKPSNASLEDNVLVTAGYKAK